MTLFHIHVHVQADVLVKIYNVIHDYYSKFNSLAVMMLVNIFYYNPNVVHLPSNMCRKGLILTTVLNGKTAFVESVY